jgi:hypothetical protein
MIRAILLATGAVAYLYATQLNYDKATAGLLDVQNLYTHSFAAGAAISAEDR